MPFTLFPEQRKVRKQIAIFISFTRVELPALQHPNQLLKPITMGNYQISYLPIRNSIMCMFWSGIYLITKNMLQQYDYEQQSTVSVHHITWSLSRHYYPTILPSGENVGQYATLTNSAVIDREVPLL